MNEHLPHIEPTMQALKQNTTVEEYFRLDEESEERMEYWYGYPVALAGERRNHAVVKTNVFQQLDQQRSDCLALPSGLRVNAPSYGRANYAYPDVLMVCGEERYDESVNPPVLLNPTLLVEVTSESTSTRDFKDKLDAYFEIDDLVEYWIVDPDQPRVHQYVRQEDALVVRLHRGAGAVVRSEALELEVPLADVYARVELE